MSNLKTKVATTGVITGSILYVILGGLGILIHFWTILIALGESGFIAALATFCLPVLSQIFWGFIAWSNTGTLFNTYCIALSAYVGIFILCLFLFGFFASKLED